jgi:thioredoxin-like negative regulator of GroEL
MNGQLVFFYAPWCGYCKQFGSSWDNLFTNYNLFNGIQLIKVDCDKFTDLAKKHNITGYPTIKYLPNGLYGKSTNSIEFQGDRTYDNVALFLQSL